MKLYSIIFPTLLGGIFYALSSCSSTPNQNYADPNQVELVGEYWNETDARLTSQKMVNEMIAGGWIHTWREENNQSFKARPFVLVDDFENRTSEHIDTKAIFENVRTDLINSGKVRFLDGAVRDKLLSELKHQNTSELVKKDKSKKIGQQNAADFFLFGAISKISSEDKGYRTIFYQIEMRLTDIESGEIVWASIEKIKKQFKKSSIGR